MVHVERSVGCVGLSMCPDSDFRMTWISGTLVHHGRHFYLSAVRPILEYCSVVWHHGLTKTRWAAWGRTKARNTNHFWGHFYLICLISLRWYTRISHLYTHRHALRGDLNKTFFRKILNNALFDLWPPPRDAAIIGRLRSAHLFPVLRTRTSKYRSFIHHSLTNYQPKLKWIISLFNHIVSVTKTVHFVLWYYCWHCFY